MIICDFPEIEYLNEETKTCDLIDIYFGKLEDMIKVRYQPSRPGRRLQANQSQQLFEVIEASGSDLVIQLIFDHPESVSDDDEIDIALDFSFLENNEEKGRVISSTAEIKESFSYKVPLVKLNVEVEEVKEESILSPQGVMTSVALIATLT